MEYHRMSDSSPSYLTHLSTATAVKTSYLFTHVPRLLLVLSNIDWAIDHELVHCLRVLGIQIEAVHTARRLKQSC